MNYAKIIKYDTGNWSGINTTIFFSGCHFNCEGCFNKEAQDFKYGTEFTQDTINQIIEYALSDHVVGLNILGGEPFDQNLDKMYDFLLEFKKKVAKPIHVWSGYLYEDILRDSKKLKLLTLIDTLVDGQFILNKKDLSLQFRGSSNQRVIDVQKSLKNNKIKLIIK